MAKKTEMSSGASCCGCKCHGVACWVTTLCMLVLGIVGVWYQANFLYALGWILIIVAVLKIASKMCKCC